MNRFWGWLAGVILAVAICVAIDAHQPTTFLLGGSLALLGMILGGIEDNTRKD